LKPSAAALKLPYSVEQRFLLPSMA